MLRHKVMARLWPLMNLLRCVALRMAFTYSPPIGRWHSYNRWGVVHLLYHSLIFFIAMLSAVYSFFLFFNPALKTVFIQTLMPRMTRLMGIVVLGLCWMQSPLHQCSCVVNNSEPPISAGIKRSATGSHRVATHIAWEDICIMLNKFTINSSLLLSQLWSLSV